MFPPFPEEEAFEICSRMIYELDSGILEMEQITTESEERSGHGVMLGVLVCKDSNDHRFILKTVSGISKRLKYSNQNKQKDNTFTEVFVEPVVSAEKINCALKKNDSEIHNLTDKIKALKESRRRSDGRFDEQSEAEKALISRRQILCNESLRNVYELYSFCCSDGQKRSLPDICKSKLPPTGTGDCCAPKLLNYAFENNLVPISMSEVFYGKNTENKIKGEKYEPCDNRCALILPEILGLKILYRDKDIIVVNKQSGVLSVPGRGPDKQDCIVNRFKRLFPDALQQPSVHRLDMETSGLLVLAFNEAAHRNLNKQFENKEVKKEYIAVIDGKLPERFEEHGQMELFFRVDLDNRPHQMWDEVYGKSAVTEWQKLGEEMYTAPDGSKRLATRMRFFPHTGRTHQLRLAAANEHGFGVPIIGDTLYGKCEEGERLLLHAEYLSFVHPVTGKRMEFHCPSDF